MAEAESSSKMKHSRDLQEGSSHIWQGIRLVLESATKWVPRFKPKQTRYRTCAKGRSLRQFRKESRQSASLLMGLQSWFRISWRLLFALATNCFSFWSMKQPTRAHKSTFARPILRKEGGTFFRPRSVMRRNPEKISAISFSFPPKFTAVAWGLCRYKF